MEKFVNIDMKSGVFETPEGKFRLDGGHVHDLIAEFRATMRYEGFWGGTCETCGKLISQCLEGSDGVLNDAIENARCGKCGDGKKLRFEFVQGENRQGLADGRSP